MKNAFISTIIQIIYIKLIISQNTEGNKSDNDPYFSSFNSIKKYYISENGSTFIFDMLNCIECNFTHYFYPNISYPYYLEECKEIKFNNSLIYSPFNHPIYCKIKENELNYFKNYDDDLDNAELAYNNINNDQRIKTNFVVVKLDTNKHPVFKVDYFFIPEEVSFNNNSRFSLMVTQEGEVENNKSSIKFNIIVGLESNERNDTCILSCNSDIEYKTFLIVCHIPEETFKIFNISNYTYNSGYLYPYIIPSDDSIPFDVIIPGIMEAIPDFQIPLDDPIVYPDDTDGDEDPGKFTKSDYLSIYYYYIILSILILI